VGLRRLGVIGITGDSRWSHHVEVFSAGLSRTGLLTAILGDPRAGALPPAGQGDVDV
jgi:hypothetical protein